METNPHTIAALNVASKLDAAANAAASVALTAANADDYIVIQKVIWSYDGAPTGGNLIINFAGSTADIDVDITAGGPGDFDFGSFGGVHGAANENVTITLAAGGAGVTGKVSVIYQ